MKFHTWLALGLMAAALPPACAAAAPMRNDHPIVGTWDLTVPDSSCHEIYRIHSDGTSIVTSAQEVAQSQFEIADQPDKLGFYKQTDTIVKDNGKQDCSGQVTEVGRAVTSYILFHPSGNMFLMCLERDTQKCIGPFIRMKGAET
jgi:hypothetical protein